MKVSKKEIIVYSFISIIILAVLAAFAVLVLTYYPYEFSMGDGSKGNPYIIKSEEDLEGLAKNVNNGIDYNGNYFRLDNDISWSKIDWSPIGTNKHPFRGMFDGNGKKISDFSIKTDNEFLGFFGVVENTNDEYAITDLFLTLNSVESEGDIDSLGGLVGRLVGNIRNIKVVGNIVADNRFSNVGLIVGNMEGSASKCEADGTLTTILNSSQQGFVGGAFGRVDGSLTDCTSRVFISEQLLSEDVSAINVLTGGVVGYVEGENRQLKQCLSTQQLNSIGNVGGIVGSFSNDIEIKDCSRSGKLVVVVYDESSIGGIFSYSEKKANIVNCQNDSGFEVIDKSRDKLTSTLYVGGICGIGKADITNSCNSAFIEISSKAHAYVGGVAGKLEGNIKNCYHNGNIRVFAHYDCVTLGGLVGLLNAQTAKIESSYVLGKVMFSDYYVEKLTQNESRVGFLVGEYSGTDVLVKNVYYVTDNYATSDDVCSYPLKKIGGFAEESINEESSLSDSAITYNTLTSGYGLQGFEKFFSESDLLVYTNKVWVFYENGIPIFYYQVAE